MKLELKPSSELVCSMSFVSLGEGGGSSGVNIMMQSMANNPGASFQIRLWSQNLKIFPKMDQNLTTSTFHQAYRTKLPASNMLHLQITLEAA